MRGTIPLKSTVTLDALLKRVGIAPRKVTGSRKIEIRAVAADDEATAGCLAFVRDRTDEAKARIARSEASVIVVEADVEERADACFVLTDNAMLWFVHALEKLFPPPVSRGIHPAACVGGQAELGEDVEVGPFAVIEDGARIGARCRMGAHVRIHGNAQIGADCMVGGGTVIGTSGLAGGWQDEQGVHDFPHLGSVIIADNVHLGEHCCVVRGLLKDTRIGRGTRIGNYVNIGHNSDVGERCWIAAGVILCGSCIIENDVNIAAAARLANRVRIGAGARVAFSSAVTKSVPTKTTVFGVPARPIATIRPF